MAQEKDSDDPFHDSESEDIFDLITACNGLMHEGLLDIRVLDEFSPEEAEALNVERLKEIWAHTATGCLKCANIVRSLNTIRGTLRQDAEELLQEQAIALEKIQ